MSQLADDLRAARALIDTPEKWGKGKDYESPYPPRYCAQSAAGRATRGTGRGMVPLCAALEEAVGTPLGGEIWRWNDDPATTHADVLAVFDKAIAAAEARP